MQKVSKQSLAMIALSILLAISIALTFTFAATNNSKTATGSIQFSGEKYVTLTDGGDAVTIDSDGNATITFAQSDFDLSQNSSTGVVSATSNSSALTKLGQVGITFSNATSAEATITFTNNTASSGNVITVTTKTPSTTTVAAGGKVTTLTLASYIESLAVSEVTANEFTFTVTIALN